MEVQLGDRVRYNGYINTPTADTVPAIQTATVIGYDETMIYTSIHYYHHEDSRTQNAIWDENVNISYGARRSGFHKSRLIEIIKPLKEIAIPQGLSQSKLF